MKNELLRRWLCGSDLTLFFTDPDRWLDRQGYSGDVSVLRQEYEDLFMGTNASVYIPLWASVSKYEDGCLLDKTTLKIVREYHRFGYEPVPMDGNPPDYIAQQIRFLCYLYACALRATSHGEDGEHYRNAADEFISLYFLDTARAVISGIRRFAVQPMILAVADKLADFCEGRGGDVCGDAEDHRESLLCFDTYMNGAADAIEDAAPRTIITAGRNNCGGKCSIRAVEEDGCLVDLETGCDIGEPSLRACVRGRGYRRTYLTGERLRYPMKRIGERGEGRFRRISWEEAADLIASEWKRIRETYGPGARYVNYGTGVSALIRPDRLVQRLLNFDGGYLDRYGSYSSACAGYVTPYIYGDVYSGNSTEDLLNTKLLILWAHNPTETIFSPQLSYTIAMAKERGTKVIVIDPRNSDTAVAFADEWIPVAPSSDGALANAMAYVIWSEGLQDQAFMDRCCVGFDEDHMPEGAPKEQNFRNYLFGGLDGIAKTPEWAEKITGVPADMIRRLAREYAAVKPACILPGLGCQRVGNGEQAVRAIAALTCMTGNVGIPGGGAAGIGLVREEAGPSFPIGERAYPGIISCFLWMQAIEDGKSMTKARDHIRGVEKLDEDIKLFFNLASNTLINQHSDINHTVEVLKDTCKVEFLVCSDVFMTPSAKFADILLPAPSFLEEDNISSPWRAGHYLLHNTKVIEPLFGCRTEYDWLGDVARRLGLWEKWSCGREDHTLWLEHLYEKLRKKEPELPPYAEFKANGGYTYRDTKPYIAYADQCRDPESHPFNTPSGKIEIYSGRLVEFGDPVEIPALPSYVPCPEGPEDPLRERYPLQLIGWHTKRRCHSIHDNNPLMEEADPQKMWIHPEDARSRGIANGEAVEVFNDRGKLTIPALITDRIARGTVAIAQGAWYAPDADGIDRRGSINVLTSPRPTPLARGNPQHTNLVEVKRISG